MAEFEILKSILALIGSVAVVASLSWVVVGMWADRDGWED